MLVACSEAAVPIADARASDAGDPCDTTERCDVEGARMCADDRALECVRTTSCLEWRELERCGDGYTCEDGACRGDCYAPGTHRGRTLVSGGERRSYLLHVPASVSCDAPAPLWIDLHGTASDTPEEAYALEPLLALAEREGVVIARPRSRSSDEGGQRVYRWDQSPGDLDRNRVFIEALVHDLGRHLRIDPARLYVSGFSSGSDMAAQLLAASSIDVRGLGIVGGGVWNDIAMRDLAGAELRVYASTGYRDYLHVAHDRLLGALLRASLPADRVLERETDGGHELYGWHYEDMWRWLDRAERDVDGVLSAGWLRERDVIPRDESMLALAAAPDGTMVAVGRHAVVLGRTREGEWHMVESATSSGPGVLVDACFGPDGTGVATGDGFFAHSELDRSWTLGARVPDPGGAMLGYAHLNALACTRSGEVLGAGYWAAVSTLDAGHTFEPVAIEGEWEGARFAAQSAAIAEGALGSVIAVGYPALVARSAPDRTLERGAFVPIEVPGDAAWLLDVDEGAPGEWWIVGDEGTILASTDDGVTWSRQESGTRYDLYAIDVAEDGEGYAVGRGGTALRTVDRGAHWEAIPTGLSGFMGDVVRLAPGRAIVVGERGTILGFDASER